MAIQNRLTRKRDERVSTTSPKGNNSTGSSYQGPVPQGASESTFRDTGVTTVKPSGGSSSSTTPTPEPSAGNTIQEQLKDIKVGVGGRVTIGTSGYIGNTIVPGTGGLTANQLNRLLREEANKQNIRGGFTATIPQGLFEGGLVQTDKGSKVYSSKTNNNSKNNSNILFGSNDLFGTSGSIIPNQVQDLTPEQQRQMFEAGVYQTNVQKSFVSRVKEFASKPTISGLSSLFPRRTGSGNVLETEGEAFAVSGLQSKILNIGGWNVSSSADFSAKKFSELQAESLKETPDQKKIDVLTSKVNVGLQTEFRRKTAGDIIFTPAIIAGSVVPGVGQAIGGAYLLEGFQDIAKNKPASGSLKIIGGALQLGAFENARFNREIVADEFANLNKQQFKFGETQLYREGSKEGLSRVNLFKESGGLRQDVFVEGKIIQEGKKSFLYPKGSGYSTVSGKLNFDVLGSSGSMLDLSGRQVGSNILASETFQLGSKGVTFQTGKNTFFSASRNVYIPEVKGGVLYATGSEFENVAKKYLGSLSTVKQTPEISYGIGSSLKLKENLFFSKGARLDKASLDFGNDFFNLGVKGQRTAQGFTKIINLPSKSGGVQSFIGGGSKSSPSYLQSLYSSQTSAVTSAIKTPSVNVLTKSFPTASISTITQSSKVDLSLYPRMVGGTGSLETIQRTTSKADTSSSNILGSRLDISIKQAESSKLGNSFITKTTQTPKVSIAQALSPKIITENILSPKMDTLSPRTNINTPNIRPTFNFGGFGLPPVPIPPALAVPSFGKSRRKAQRFGFKTRYQPSFTASISNLRATTKPTIVGLSVRPIIGNEENRKVIKTKRTKSKKKKSTKNKKRK